MTTQYSSEFRVHSDSRIFGDVNWRGRGGGEGHLIALCRKGMIH